MTDIRPPLGGVEMGSASCWAEHLFQRMHFYPLQLPAALTASPSSSERKYRVSFSPELEKEALAEYFID